MKVRREDVELKNDSETLLQMDEHIFRKVLNPSGYKS